MVSTMVFVSIETIKYSLLLKIFGPEIDSRTQNRVELGAISVRDPNFVYVIFAGILLVREFSSSGCQGSK